ncbi:hypothetical protein EDB81DRAFT_787739 [Dactylonectria macrodidyma]|uniref:C2H2-type domain-containing protein n=1 Tax=Dactylonectria macrodidyma TaxID=307937 RepID=A0A9P9F9P0_9HYPO|nr:hypothetical protein EDB81DRAFT_787739 [Dactylonectria macrodidyma]
MSPKNLNQQASAEAPLSTSHRFKEKWHNLAYRIRSRSTHQDHPDHNSPNHGDPSRDNRDGHSIKGRLTAKRQPSFSPFESHPLATSEDNFSKPFTTKQSRVNIALDWVDLILLVWPEYAGGQCRGNGGHASTSQGANGAKRHSFQGSWPPKRKGKQPDDGRRNKKPRDDKQNGKGPKKGKPGDGDTDPKFLACPFYLRDRIRHAKCRKYKLRYVSDVRQHVVRVHRQQPLHCPRCKMIFAGSLENKEAQQQRKEHIRRNSCVNSGEEVPGLTHAQMQKLKDPEGRAGNVIDNYNGVWNILFPGIPPPEQPYLTGSEFRNEFKHYLETIWESLPGQAVPLEDRQAMEYWCSRFDALISDVEAPPPPSRNIATALDILSPGQTSMVDLPSAAPTPAATPTPSFDNNGATEQTLSANQTPDIYRWEPDLEAGDDALPWDPSLTNFPYDWDSAQHHAYDGNLHQEWYPNIGPGIVGNGFPRNPPTGFCTDDLYPSLPEDQVLAPQTHQHAQHEDQDETNGNGGFIFDPQRRDDYL